MICSFAQSQPAPIGKPLALMKVDLHVHSRDWSDGKDSARDLLKAAIARGLGGLAFADHSHMLTREDQRALQAEFPDIRVFRAAEVSMQGRDHVLLVGGTGAPLPRDERERRCDAAEVRAYCDATGAYCAVCHPFWIQPEWKFSFEELRPEAMDILSMNIDAARADLFLATLRRYRLRPLAFSDAHRAAEVGMFCVDLDERAEDDEALVAALRAGRYSLSTVEEVWELRFAEVSSAEAVAREVLARGGSEEEYIARSGGASPAFFNRVRRGGSHLPRREFLGLRGDGNRVP